jgi:hypothetical protein
MIEFRSVDLSKNIDLCVEFRKDTYQSSFSVPDEWKKYWNESEYRSWILKHSEKFPEGLLHFLIDSEIVGQLEFAWFGDSGMSIYTTYAQTTEEKVMATFYRKK